MELRDGYKSTEVGIIPEDWKLGIFKDVSYMKGRIGWQGLNQTEFTMNTNEPFLITGMNFKDGEIRWNEVYHISEERYEVAKDIQLKSDDVLMTKDGTIGKLLYVENIPFPYKATLNSHLLVFRPLKNSYNPKYLYYNLLSPYFCNHIELSKSGTTFFGISQTSVGEYKIILPPLTEQTAIATALSDADALINSLEKLIAKKRNIKQGAMQKLLQPNPDSDREGWEVKKLGDIADSTKKWSFTGGPFGSNLKSSDYTDEGVRVIQLQNIGDGDFINHSKIYTSEIKANELISCNIYPGDIILSKMGDPVARACIIPNNHSRYLMCSDGIRLALNPKEYNTFFIYTYINSPSFRTQAEDNSTGSTRKRIGLVTLRNLKLFVPSIKEQTHIATILSSMDAEIQALETKLEKYRNIKLGMMQNLLTGKIRLI